MCSPSLVILQMWLSPASLKLDQITWDDHDCLLEKTVANEICESIFYYNNIQNNFGFLSNILLFIKRCNKSATSSILKKIWNRAFMLWLLSSIYSWLVLYTCFFDRHQLRPAATFALRVYQFFHILCTSPFNIQSNIL